MTNKTAIEKCSTRGEVNLLCKCTRSPGMSFLKKWVGITGGRVGQRGDPWKD
ncbi:hypothetical protein LCGC14_1479520 [marine sediment metagenome]|uniref:Uncharacterized protein n=1 Tax=marine sediment metagenome TaxID=412755 RepID=A0A0F9MBM6_9ZZZZ